MANKIRVLIADDHEVMREGIRSLLALHHDIEVVGESANGRETIEAASKLIPDIVLMDVAMPLLDGLGATRRIRKANTKTKILVLTQYDSKEIALACIKAGADGCISKKAISSELIPAIRAVNQGDSFLYPSIGSELTDD